jgi:hypothetical protein
MTDEELEMLKAVSADAGLGQSDWVRQRIRDAYKRLRARK